MSDCLSPPRFTALLFFCFFTLLPELQSATSKSYAADENKVRSVTIPAVSTKTSSPATADGIVKCPADGNPFQPGNPNHPSCSRKSSHIQHNLRGKRLFLPNIANTSQSYLLKQPDNAGLKPKIMGVIHDLKSSASVQPSALIHVFHTKGPNLLIGKIIKSFTENGAVQRTSVLDATSDAEVVAADSHFVAAVETTYLAIAQHETSSSPARSIVLVYAVTMKNAYSLFAKIEVKSLVTDVKLFSDADGTLFLATTQRSVNCQDDFVSECGLSLIYRICVNGKAEIFSVAQLGNATHVVVAPYVNSQSFSMMLTKCGVSVKGIEQCRMLHHVERFGMMPLSFFTYVACDPKGATLFRFGDNLYYIGPDSKCQDQQISMWDYDMELLPLNIFPGQAQKWLVIESPSRDCGAALIIAGIGKEGTVFYGLESPEKRWRKLVSYPDLAIDSWWTSGKHIFTILQTPDSLTLLRLTCVRQSNKDRRDFSGSSHISADKVPLEHTVDNKSFQGIVDDYHTVAPDEVDESSYVTDSVRVNNKIFITDVEQSDSTTAVPVPITHSTEDLGELFNSTSEKPVPKSDGTFHEISTVNDYNATTHLGNFLGSSGSELTTTEALNPEIENSGCHIDTIERRGHLNLYSPFSSVIETKSGSVLVVPPTIEDPCYNLFEFSSHADLGISATSRSKFCDQVSRSVSPVNMMYSKSAAHSNAGNIYVVSSYGDVLEFASVIKDNAVFDIKRAKPGVNFTSLSIRVCEGFPTACAVVRNCRTTDEKDCSADLRCYRMFKLTWLPVISINVSIDTTIHMETYLKSDQCMLITESSFKRSNVVRFYKMRSTLRELDMSEPLEVRMCEKQPLQTIAIQRSIWLTAAVPDLNGQCAHSLFELILDPDQLETRLSLSMDRVMLITSKNAMCCNGEILVIQNFFRPNVHRSYLMRKGFSELQQVSFDDQALGSSGKLSFFLVDDQQFLLVRNGTTGYIYEIQCAFVEQHDEILS